MRAKNKLIKVKKMNPGEANFNKIDVFVTSVATTEISIHTESTQNTSSISSKMDEM